ncbi:MAG: metal ABC transporter permease [Chloroflexota bacterium]|nr:metal ABC transporter permease [Chloroflexota bacterium]MDE2897368.1 metal ABC transporter permease [Chloroflexota bacterium]
MPAILQYEFMLRALVGGALVGVLAPVLGTFIVLRRFSLIAETLAHVALMGVAIGMATRFLPSLAALIAACLGAILVEQLRARGRLPGDVAMAVVLYGALAFAIVVIGLAGGFNVDLFSFLFGSILSVAPLDLWLLAGLTVVVVLFVGVFFVDLAQIAFDDDLARVSGVRTDLLNLGLAVLTGATITLSMRVVGVLLVGAMLVVPVMVGLRVARGLRAAMATAVVAGVLSALAGLAFAFYGDVSAGGAIVLTALALLVLAHVWMALRRLQREAHA